MRQGTEEELAVEQKRLTARLLTLLGEDLNERTADKIDETIKDHRQRCRLQGLDFPPLVAIILPGLGNLEVVHKDLDRKGIETVIVNLTRKWPGVTREDLAFGIGRAFPEYRRRVIAEQAERNRSWTPPR